MTLKAAGRTKPNKSGKVKKKIKCPFCHIQFKVTEESYELAAGVLYYYCDACGESFTDKQI